MASARILTLLIPSSQTLTYHCARSISSRATVVLSHPLEGVRPIVRHLESDTVAQDADGCRIRSAGSVELCIHVG